MGKRILILGSFDTKSDELSFLKERVADFGCVPVTMDTSTGRAAPVAVDYGAEAVAAAAGADISELRSTRDTNRATQTMIRGASRLLADLYARGGVDGVTSIGGASNTGLSTAVMGVLPFGVPKVMLSSMAAVPAYAGSYFGTKDITMIHSVVDIAGLNPLLRNAITRTASAVCAMAANSTALSLKGTGEGRPKVAMTEFKFSEKCCRRAVEVLTAAGCEVVCFHAQGLGDRAMEELVVEGVVDAVMDIVPAGISEELLGGNRAAGPGRLDAAGRAGIPQLLTPCGFEMLSCGPLERRHRGDALWSSRRLAERKLFVPDSLRVQARVNADELTLIADVVAEKLQKARGQWKFLIPSGGWSSLSEPGAPLCDVEADEAFVRRLGQKLGNGDRLVTCGMALNTPEFGEAAAEAMLGMLGLAAAEAGAVENGLVTSA